MSLRKLVAVVVALSVAPMLTGCIVAERPGYYYGPPRVRYYPHGHRWYRGSLEPTGTTVVHVDG
jgi:hypothetical protein